MWSMNLVSKTSNSQFTSSAHKLICAKLLLLALEQKKKGQPVTCVYCRAPWKDATASGSGAGDGGVDKSGA